MRIAAAEHYAPCARNIYAHQMNLRKEAEPHAHCTQSVYWMLDTMTNNDPHSAFFSEGRGRGPRTLLMPVNAITACGKAYVIATLPVHGGLNSREEDAKKRQSDLKARQLRPQDMGLKNRHSQLPIYRSPGKEQNAKRNVNVFHVIRLKAPTPGNILQRRKYAKR
eukprot:4204038-Pleurochrysis_carterae.AAC.2